jgi:L-ascorbate metabolism protein UlaG (beta-lactamase superfamily)
MVQLRWLGHAAWEISSREGILLIDPFLSQNPASPIKPQDVAKCDAILVSHDHFDHMGDAVELSKRFNAPVVAVFETANKAEQAGAKALGANLGGTLALGRIKVTLVPALHSGTSNPSGFIVETEGVRVYHSGDTALSAEMQMIGAIFKPHVALLPIGGHYTMDYLQAAEAVRLLRPRVAIPMHYNTWPQISQDPQLFAQQVKRLRRATKVVVLRPGESYSYMAKSAA